MKKCIIIITIIIATQTTYAQFGGGNGTEASPYQISTKEHLELLADSVNNSAPHPADNWSKDKYFIVINNITEPVNTVIGSYAPFNIEFSKPFSGNFDGQNYTINLEIYLTTEFSAGLFGYTAFATIKNVIVYGYVYGYDYAGGIVAVADNTTIENCINLASISGERRHLGGIAGYISRTSISNCANLGTIYGDVDGYLGGIAGYSESNANIENCINSGRIMGEGCIAGITAWAFINVSIKNCVNSGTISGSTGHSGGIIGLTHNYIFVENCINLGSITESAGHTGGIAACVSETTIIFDCVNYGFIKGIDDVGGIAGHDYGGIIENCFNTGIIEGGAEITGAIRGSE